MIDHFYFNQFDIALVICLHSFEMSNIFFCPIDMTLSGTTIPGQSEPGKNVKGGYCAFQTIQFIISTQFNISTRFSSIWPIDRTRSGATTPGQSGPESDGNKGVLRIPQSSSMTGTSSSDWFVSYQDTR